MEKMKKYWAKTSWQWKNLLTLVLGMLAVFSGFIVIWGLMMAFAAWLTMHAWSIVAVGIFGFGREISFFEAFVFYAVIAFVGNLFRSETKVIRKR